MQVNSMFGLLSDKIRACVCIIYLFLNSSVDVITVIMKIVSYIYLS